MSGDAIKKLIEDAEPIFFDVPIPDTKKEQPAFDSLPEKDRKLFNFPKNDMGNGARLRERHGHDLIYTEEAGWYGWTKSKWSLENGAALAVIQSHRTVRAMSGEMIAMSSNGMMPGEEAEDFQKRLKNFRSFIQKSGDMPRVNGALQAAAPYLTKKISDLDGLPTLITLKNGTLNLQAEPDPESESEDKVRLLKHDRKHLITREATASYRPEAKCEAFMKFMAEVLPDEETRLFLQRWLGYSLSGLTREQYVVMFYGHGSNGKSTLMDLINRIFGDYALTLPFESLLKNDNKRGSEASPDLARLPGARIVTAAEPETGAQFSESMLKQLTGGEKMVVRHLNKGFFEFHPQFKLILSFNNKPRIRGQDDGIWRRVLLVPFNQKFVSAEKLNDNPGAKLKDPALADKLREETDGIMNWLLDGWRDYLDKGLRIPDVVKMATDQYRSESDPVGEFIGEFTTHAPSYEVLSSELYTAYKAYCKQVGMKEWSIRAFGDRVTEMVINKEKRGGYIYYLGLMLNDDGVALAKGKQLFNQQTEDEGATK